MNFPYFLGDFPLKAPFCRGFRPFLMRRLNGLRQSWQFSGGEAVVWTGHAFSVFIAPKNGENGENGADLTITEI